MRVFIVTGDIFGVCDSLETALNHIIENEMGWGRIREEATMAVMSDFVRATERERHSWEIPWGEPNSSVHVLSYTIQMTDVLTS